MVKFRYVNEEVDLECVKCTFDCGEEIWVATRDAERFHYCPFCGEEVVLDMEITEEMFDEIATINAALGMEFFTNVYSAARGFIDTYQERAQAKIDWETQNNC